MKRSLILCAMLLATVFVFSGCDDDGDDSNSENGDDISLENCTDICAFIGDCHGFDDPEESFGQDEASCREGCEQESEETIAMFAACLEGVGCDAEAMASTCSD